MSVFDTERFIELVRERPFLYDGKDKKHGNRDIVQKAWEDIGKEMDCEENVCRAKWANLRNSYRRELRKMKEHKPDDGTPQEPKWAFFTLLSFLDVHLKLRESSGNFSHQNDTEDDSKDDIYTPDTSYTEEKPCFPMYEIYQKRKKPDTEAELVTEHRSLGESSSELDDDKYFLLSLLPWMKTLSPPANMMFRIETQQNLMQKLFPISTPAVSSPYRSGSRDTSCIDTSLPNSH